MFEEALVTINKLKEERYLANPKHCLECGELITFAKRVNKFCGLTCRTVFCNKRRANIRCCVVCTQRVKYGRQLTCSRTCHQIRVWTNVKTAIESSGRAPSLVYARKYLEEVHGYFCFKCKLTDWQNADLTFELDHIDGDADNWLLANLRFLCPNCHSQTTTYRNKNKGNGRALRRDRDRLDYARKTF